MLPVLLNRPWNSSSQIVWSSPDSVPDVSLSLDVNLRTNKGGKKKKTRFGRRFASPFSPFLGPSRLVTNPSRFALAFVPDQKCKKRRARGGDRSSPIRAQFNSLCPYFCNVRSKHHEQKWSHSGNSWRMNMALKTLEISLCCCCCFAFLLFATLYTNSKYGRRLAIYGSLYSYSYGFAQPA